MKKLILIAIVVCVCISGAVALQKYDCIESHSPVTRKFASIKEYQTNNLRFNSKYNFVAFATPTIQKLQTNAFVAYESNYIRKLTLSNKQCELLDDGAFNELFCVRYLLLQNNAIRRLQNGSFAGLHSVEELDLSHNQIDKIPRTAFWNLKHLLKLDLSYNNINFVSERAFDTLVSLWEINLQHNLLSELPNDLFLPSKHIRRLNVAHNLISTPTIYDFTNLIRLDSLDLSQNTIAQLPPLFFDNLTTLTDVNLADNALTDLNITSLPKLTRVNIQNNRFQCTKLRAILRQLENREIGVVVHQNTEFKNVNVTNVGCFNGVTPTFVTTTTVKPSFRPFSSTAVPDELTTVLHKPEKTVVQDKGVVLEAVNSVKTMLVIFIIILVLFHIVDVVLRTHNCSRLRQRQRLYPFPVGRGNDASLPLLSR